MKEIENDYTAKVENVENVNHSTEEKIKTLTAQNDIAKKSILESSNIVKNPNKKAQKDLFVEIKKLRSNKLDDSKKEYADTKLTSKIPKEDLEAKLKYYRINRDLENLTKKLEEFKSGKTSIEEIMKVQVNLNSDEYKVLIPFNNNSEQMVESIEDKQKVDYKQKDSKSNVDLVKVQKDINPNQVKSVSNHAEKSEKDKIPVSTNVEKNSTFVSDTKPVKNFTRGEKKEIRQSCDCTVEKNH